MKKFKDMFHFLVLVTTLASFGMAGTFLYTEYLYKKDLPDNDSEMQELLTSSIQNTVPVSFDLNKTTINLKSATGRLRFLDIVLHLILFKSENLGLLEKKSALLYDLLIQIAGQYSPSDLNSVTGKMLFEENFKNALNKRLGNKIVKEIYFSKFVIQ